MINNIKINLKGLIVADGLMNPAAQAEWADFIYAAGVTDPNYRDQEQLYDTAVKEAFF